MIGKLSGIVDWVAQDHVLLDVQGVGYIVYCSVLNLQKMTVGEPVNLYTDMIVREDLLQLYGFNNIEEKEWHRLLMSVQGVGAKAALAIAGAIGVANIERAIALEDTGAIRKAPGVGPKLALRIIRELSGKVPDIVTKKDNNNSKFDPVSIQSSTQPVLNDAIEALVGLGYEPARARSVLMQQENGDKLSVAIRIKAALKVLGQEVL